MNILLLYEDAETGLRAKGSLEVVQAEKHLGDRLRVRLWRLDLLQTAWLREQAAIEAAASQVIIISLHAVEDVPQELRQWLTAWVERRDDQPCALGVLLDHRIAAQHPTGLYFKSVASAAGADLLWGFYGVGPFRAAMARDRVPPDSMGSPGAAVGDYDRSASQSHWGINE